MSLNTWTPAALSRERRPLRGRCWRVVEAQYRVSTMKLADTVEEQERIEVLLEATKPPVPPECRHLHYLLSTPFRYGAPHPGGSRFRRAGFTPGVFYASSAVRTSIAELAFHRLLFFVDSPGTPWPQNAGEYTAFSVAFRTAAGLDLTAAPLDRHRTVWRHSTDYGPCQHLADAARETGVEVVRYESARDEGGVNLALLACRTFASLQPIDRQTWRLHLGPGGVLAVCAFPEARLGFDRSAFANDPRMTNLSWDR